MPPHNFRDLLEQKWSEGKFVCVGLDSDVSKIPPAVRLEAFDDFGPNDSLAQYHFNQAIVCTTADLVVAYKLNLAFYAQGGPTGICALARTIWFIHEFSPGVPIILDGKFADIGNTNQGYVQFAFQYLKADAVTVHPYLGREALQPFLDCADRGVFVLCRTSNPGAGEFQDLTSSEEPLYRHVVRHVTCEWNAHLNCGLVAGATYPDELAEIRCLAGDMPLLIPGIGAQGGEVEATVCAGKDSHKRGMIINSSRGIIFASAECDFAGAARRETEKLHQQIRAAL
jgi:orotidine-5'-phosphate decarboxylase